MSKTPPRNHLSLREPQRWAVNMCTVYITWDNCTNVGWHVYIVWSQHTKLHFYTFFLPDFTSISLFTSHLTDVFQPVATAVFWQSEADVTALLPATADLPEPHGHTGHEEGHAAQQYRHGENEDQREGGGQEEVVLVWIEGTVPAEEERVEGGHGQSAVTQRGLQMKEGRHRLKFGGGGRQPLQVSCVSNVRPTPSRSRAVKWLFSSW